MSQLQCSKSLAEALVPIIDLTCLTAHNNTAQCSQVITSGGALQHVISHYVHDPDILEQTNPTPVLLKNSPITLCLEIIIRREVNLKSHDSRVKTCLPSISGYNMDVNSNRVLLDDGRAGWRCHRGLLLCGRFEDRS